MAFTAGKPRFWCRGWSLTAGKIETKMHYDYRTRVLLLHHEKDGTEVFEFVRSTKAAVLKLTHPTSIRPMSISISFSLLLCSNRPTPGAWASPQVNSAPRL